MKFVFVTSGAWSGDLQTAGGVDGGLPSGDALCTQAANAAGLGGTWTAWLSTTADNVDAPDRFDGGGPWRLRDAVGTVVFNNVASLTALPAVPIDRDEFGANVDAGQVWTGTSGAGLSTGVTCNDFRNSATSGRGTWGTTASRQSTWSEFADSDCSVLRRLYCFQR